MNTQREVWMRGGRRTQSERRRTRPRLDLATAAGDHLLEPRLLLSTMVVNNVNDSGPGSLRAAIAQATSGESIVFARRLAGRTISLQSEIDVTTNVSIKGPAGRSVALSGGGTTRVLEIHASVSLANLVITQGSADIGGGILDSNGSLSLNNVRFTGNVADGSSTEIAQGGAIAQQGGSLSINRSTFTGNHVIGDPQSPVALPSPIIDPLPLAVAYLNDAIFEPTPTHYGGEADGGAIADQGGTLVLNESYFSGNMAKGSPVQTAQTGGDASGGALFIANASLTSSGTTFESNQAVGGNFVNDSSTSAALGAGGTAAVRSHPNLPRWRSITTRSASMQHRVARRRARPARVEARGVMPRVERSRS